jgi:glutamate-5-semialdehyde dehydrogenase
MSNKAPTETAIPELMDGMGRAARDAARSLSLSCHEARNSALRAAAQAVRNTADEILQANQQDLDAARERGLGAALLDRLLLDAARVEAIAQGLEAVADLPDPLARVIAEWDRPNGLAIQRVTVPLGVIGIIYESRPNVTADAAALCIKSGNAVILRGGSESRHSSFAIFECIQQGLQDAGLSDTAAQLVPTVDRAAVSYLLSSMAEWVDVVVPRGGKGLIQRVKEDARIPVIGHLEGICHVYVHADADVDMARDVVLKTVLSIVSDALPASESDWSTEYLDAIISVRVVEDIDDAIDHIAEYGSGHTEAIVTGDSSAAEHFFRDVDSAILLHNASTQFADGGEFGMGAEIGIATGRIHARGPVGANELTSYKYVVRGTGQVRS